MPGINLASDMLHTTLAPPHLALSSQTLPRQKRHPIPVACLEAEFLAYSKADV